MKLPRLIFNFKAYKEASGKRAVLFAKICSKISKKYRVKIGIAPQYQDIYLISKKFKNLVIFSQHIDPYPPGAFTGHVVAENLKGLIDGSFLNHSEKPMELKDLKECIRILKKQKLISLVFVSTPFKARIIAKFSPHIIAIEPPELIGTGVSVSRAKPEVVAKTVEKVKRINSKVKVYCGAGISSAEDVRKAFELGAEGVAIASAFVKSKNPRLFLKKIVEKARSYLQK